MLLFGDAQDVRAVDVAPARAQSNGVTAIRDPERTVTFGLVARSYLIQLNFLYACHGIFLSQPLSLPLQRVIRFRC